MEPVDCSKYKSLFLYLNLKSLTLDHKVLKIVEDSTVHTLQTVCYVWSSHSSEVHKFRYSHVHDDVKVKNGLI